MIAFLKEWDGILSCICDLVCTGIMLYQIAQNRHRIEDLETTVCQKTGRRKRFK